MNRIYGLQQQLNPGLLGDSMLPLSLHHGCSLHLGHFPGKPGLASFIGVKDAGSGGDNWRCKICTAPVKMSPKNTNAKCFTGRMPFLSPNQQRQSMMQTETRKTGGEMLNGSDRAQQLLSPSRLCLFL